MRKLMVAAAALAVLALAAPAQAQTIVRDGADYSGYANPNGCEILVHTDRPAAANDLHVKCTPSVGADGPARIRYRFLRDVGGEFRPADVEVEYKAIRGDASVRWMVPTPRTVRVIVRGYVHIQSVTWTQD